MKDKLTVYYDGGCPLCHAEIGLYRKQEGAENVDFVDLSQLPADPAADLSKEAAMARFHVRGGDGALRSGASGFALLWRSLPAWRWLGVIAEWPAISWFLELAYRAFLPLRPHLARLLSHRR
jgi:predicted DCC family thiol-disulfide oxidoreductase YuxK